MTFQIPPREHTLSLIEWRRACMESQLRAKEKHDEVSPHPWPHGRDWLWVIFLLALVAAVIAAAWLLVPS